jgi:hypothetical protein
VKIYKTNPYKKGTKDYYRVECNSWKFEAIVFELLITAICVVLAVSYAI